MHKISKFTATLLIGAGMASAGMAQELVINGEVIASAETFAAAKAEGRFVHYGAYPTDPMTHIHQAFTADTGIQVDHIRMSAHPLHQRIISEAGAGRLEADLIDLTDMLLLEDLLERGILGAPWRVTSFDLIDEGMREDEGRWYTYLNSTAIIGVNTAIVPEEDWPTGYMDFLDPKYEGELSITIMDGGSAFAQYGLMNDLGETYWEDLQAQNPRLYESVAALTSDLARGDIGIAVGPFGELALAQIEVGAPLKIIFASEGVPAYGISGGISTTATHPNAAGLFLDWITSRRGGEVIAEVYAYGAHPDSPAPSSDLVQYPDRAALFSYGMEDWETRYAPYRERFIQVFGK